MPVELTEPRARPWPSSRKRLGCPLPIAALEPETQLGFPSGPCDGAQGGHRGQPSLGPLPARGHRTHSGLSTFQMKRWQVHRLQCGPRTAGGARDTSRRPWSVCMCVSCDIWSHGHRASSRRWAAGVRIRVTRREQEAEQCQQTALGPARVVPVPTRPARHMVWVQPYPFTLLSTPASPIARESSGPWGQLLGLSRLDPWHIAWSALQPSGGA